jgi:antitoxin (DNA-binding transcriptional repressor) of toxin-antitoxin stability system
METVGAYEAKTHLRKLPEREIKGDRITNTKHGFPVAVLQPSESLRKAEPKQVIAEQHHFLSNHRLNGFFAEMIEQEPQKMMLKETLALAPEP